MKCDKCQLETLQNSTIITLLDKGWRVSSRCPRCGHTTNYEREGFHVGTHEHLQEASSNRDAQDNTGHPEQSIRGIETDITTQGSVQSSPERGNTPCNSKGTEQTETDSEPRPIEGETSAIQE